MSAYGVQADLGQDALVDEAGEAGGEDVAGDVQPGRDLVEAPVAEEDLAHDQHRPALADQLERLGDAAVLAFVAATEHVSLSVA